MCRFLLVKSKKPIDPQGFIEEFSNMAQKSRAPDGDLQEDGFGIAFQNIKYQISNIKNTNKKLDGSKWKTHKNLKPIWECKNEFNNFPKTQYLAVHARGASFPQHKGVIEFNQPYISKDLCFVFNGTIKGVRLKRNLTGEIGAQKIFSFICQELKTKNPDEALRLIDQSLLDNAREIIGLNIGLIVKDRLFALCEYTQNPKYFSLRYYKDRDISLICSEPIGLYNWQTMKKGEVIKL